MLCIQQPIGFDFIQHHQAICLRLKNLVKYWNEIPHLFIHGPEGSGKKTIVNALLYEKYSKSMKEKQNFIEISNTFGFVLAEILNLINPIIPFVSEKISKDLGFSQESLFFKKINKINDNKNFRVREINEFEKIIKLIKKIRIEATDEINKKIQIS